jgi:hypothetical protein
MRMYQWDSPPTNIRFILSNGSLPVFAIQFEQRPI